MKKIERSLLAKRIPDVVILEIVQNDLIRDAIPIYQNQTMILLSKVWYKYVEPGEENIDCNICKARILNCFKAVENELKTIANEYLLSQL